jgi:predicted PurR-regulated permease PerM
VVIGLVMAATIMLVFLWYAVDVLLLLFAAILLGVFLRGLSDWVSRRSRLTEGWALAVVMLGLLGITARLARG